MELPIKSTEELKHFLPVNVSFDFENLRKPLKTALRKYILPLTGRPFYDKLLATEFPDNFEQEILDEIRCAAVNFAYAAVLPFTEVTTGSTGTHRVEGKNAKKLEDIQRTALLKQAYSNGYESCEEILRLLDEKQPELWLSSEACADYNKLFVRSAAEVDEFIPISGSRFIFLKMKQALNRAQNDYIRPLLGPELFEQLGEKFENNTLTAELKDLLRYIRPAMAHIAYAESLPYIQTVTDTDGLWVKDKGSLTHAQKALPQNLESLLIRKNETLAAAKIQALKAYLQENVRSFAAYEFSKYYIKDSHKPVRASRAGKIVNL